MTRYFRNNLFSNETFFSYNFILGLAFISHFALVSITKMGHQVTVASAQLAQMALDFEGNTNRIIESCRLAKEAGAKLRVGPELEISGYGVQDSFLEADTYFHSWECVEKILQHPHCQDILLDIGLPVMHRNVRYNCRLLILNGDILLIRPKIWLANDGK